MPPRKADLSAFLRRNPDYVVVDANDGMADLGQADGYDKPTDTLPTTAILT
jgi:hypothetical protein